MRTAAPELTIARTWPPAAMWIFAGLWAMASLPPDGSAGLLLGAMWAALLLLRWLPWSQWSMRPPRIAGLCCPAARPRVSDVAMGWMMGTLWWHTEGCLTALLPSAATVVLHLLLMLVLGQVAAALAPFWQRFLACTAFALIAAWPLWSTAMANSLWPCMALLTLAWVCEPAGRLPGSLFFQRALVSLCGPLGLWFILTRWPVAGPDALLQPMVVLALMALTFSATTATNAGEH